MSVRDVDPVVCGDERVRTGSSDRGEALHPLAHPVARLDPGLDDRPVPARDVDRPDREALVHVRVPEARNAVALALRPLTHFPGAEGRRRERRTETRRIGLRVQPLDLRILEHAHVRDVEGPAVRRKGDAERIAAHGDARYQPTGRRVQDHDAEVRLVHAVDGPSVRRKDEVPHVAVLPAAAIVNDVDVDHPETAAGTGVEEQHTALDSPAGVQRVAAG